jgi:hypothetical protein
MKVNADLFEVLRIMRTDAVVVIATDNMDCFVRAFENARTRPRKPRLPVGGTLADWAKTPHKAGRPSGGRWAPAMSPKPRTG